MAPRGGIVQGRCMANLIGNNPITAAGTYTLPIAPGQRYALSASSASWAGSVTVGFLDGAGNITNFPDSPLSANGGFEFVAPAGVLNIVTSATMTVQIAVVPIKCS